MARMNLQGKKFAELTVLYECGKDKNKQVLWMCECSCGNKTEVTSYRLNKGITRSCGCLRIKAAVENSKNLGESNKTHGMSRTRIYKIHRGMKDRCLKPNDMHFHHYGGRGITVCDEWRNDFMNFYNWSMKNGYNDDLSIDRIDVNGNYEPSNCRWATNQEQGRNKRDNRYITYEGETKTLVEWSEIFKIKAGTLIARIDRYGMTFEEAISDESKRLKKYLVTDATTFEEFILLRKEVADKTGVSLSGLRRYLDKDVLWNNKYLIQSYDVDMIKKTKEELISYIGEDIHRTSNNLRSRKVRCITTGEVFDAVSYAGKKYNRGGSDISGNCNGKTKYCGIHPETGEKLVWEYL